jgi:hypothetical protein
LGKAPDKIQLIAMYGSKAFTSSAGNTFSSNYVGNSAAEDQRIALWKARGNNLVYLTNTNFISGGGFMGTTYSTAGKAKLKTFIKKCYNEGIAIGVVGGIAFGTGPAYGDASYNPGPALRVVDYNNGVAFDEKITNFLIEEEYWREIGGNMNFTQFKLACQNIYNILHPAGVSNDIYFVRNAPTEAAQLAPYIDIWWMTMYLSAAGGDNQIRYDKIRPWIQELAATLPATPIKVGGLISLESYSYNKTGGNDSASNFVGYQAEGRRIGAPFVNPQPIVTSAKNFNQLADKVTHNGTVGLPPIDFNSEPASVTNYINWMGIQVFDDDLNPNLPRILDANTNQVFAFGDGSPQDSVEFGVAQQVAGLVPQNAARFLYLGDVYNTGTQAEFIQNTFSFDKLYGTQSTHNLLILTSATPGQREWANRSVGYDPYWNGSLAGVGSVQPNWDGDRTITNPHYYSFYLPADDGTLWKFISINSMEDGFPNGGVTLGSTMYNWLVNELNDSSVGRRKIVFCHHPRFSSDGTYGDNANMQPVWDAMQNKAMILLSGRVHNYQRMNMRDSAGNVVVGGGVYQVISGTGGTATFGFAGSYLAGAIGYRANNNGATRLTLYNDHVDVCFVRNDGVVLDCASLPVATTIPPIVYAGPDQSITLPALATMAGTATDTNTPTFTLINIWTKISGPGTVVFTDPNSLTTTVSFSASGTYVLRLTSNNGQNSSFDEMTVTVSSGAATKQVIVQSTPVGVTITLSISDINGNGNGVTNFSRTYLQASTPTLTAPSTFGSYVFIKWLKDGVDFSYGLTITASDTINRTYTAIYALTPNVAYVVTVNSTPATGVTIGGTLSGVVPQSGYVIGGDTMTLSAPATYGGRAFVEWQKNGVTLSASRNTTNVVTTDSTYTAVYASAAGDFDIICYAIYGATYFDPVKIRVTPSEDCYLVITPSLGSTAIVFEGSLLAGVSIDCFVECGVVYAAVCDNYSADFGYSTISVPFKALPSAQVQITQPTVIGGTGQFIISSPGSVPYDVAPLGQGTAAGVLYTSALSVAGSYSHVVGLTAIESAILTNLVIDGDLVSDPFALAVPWTTTGAATYDVPTNSVLVPALTADTVTIPIDSPTTPSTTVRWLIGVWYGNQAGFSPAAGAVELFYNGVMVASSLNTNAQYITAVVTPIGGLYEFEVVFDGTAAVDSYIRRTVVLEYDVTFNAVLVDPAAVTASDVITNVTCNGGADGEIALTTSGGAAPYTYLWTKTGFPSNVYPNSATLTALDAGTYNVLITDNNGDTFTDSYIVTEPAAIVANLTTTNVTCNGSANGTATFAPSGGTGPYTYVIDGVLQPSNVATNIDIGPHIYLVIDSNGCTVSGTFTITQPAAVTSSLAITNVACYGGSSGQLVVTAGGGTAPYEYSYDGAGYVSSNTKTGLSAGGHTVIVKDANGCLKSTDYAVGQPADIVVVKTVTNPSYAGASDGSIGLAITGGTYPIVVTWADGTIFNLASSGSILYDGLPAGTYTATVVDANSCSKNVSQALVDPPDVPPVDPPSDVDVDRFSVIANCCLGDKIYEVFKGYANGHVALDCIAYPAMLLSEKVMLLRKWYTLGQTLGGSKGIFVFSIISTPVGFNNRRFTISMPGLPTVVYNGDLNINYSANMTLFIDALVAAGYDAEYESDSGYIFIYSPMNSFYNGVMVSVTASVLPSLAPAKISVFSKNGFMGAVTPCVTSDKFTPNCLSVNDKNLLIEQIRIACDSCLCGDYKINDRI